MKFLRFLFAARMMPFVLMAFAFTVIYLGAAHYRLAPVVSQHPPVGQQRKHPLVTVNTISRSRMP